MDYRQLGHSGLRVSALTLGTMTFGGRGNFAKVGATDVDAATRQVDMCLDAGVNLIDTADVYSGGLSEEIVGKTLKGRRDRVLLATKARMPMGDGPNDAGLSRHHLIRACEASLRRLGTDYIDLYQVHEWDGHDAARGDARRARPPRPLRQGALHRLLQLRRLAAHEGARHLRAARPPALRLAADLLLAAGARRRVRARARSRSTRASASSSGARSPAACCRASTAAARTCPEGSRHLTDWNEPPVRDEDKLYDIVDVLVEIAEARGVSPAQVALAWTLGRPGVASVVVGARTEEQLADNLGAADLVLARRRARAARRGERAAAALPVLAPGEDVERPPQRGRPDAAGSARLSDRPTAYWLKAVGHARGPLAEDWIDAAARAAAAHGLPAAAADRAGRPARASTRRCGGGCSRSRGASASRAERDHPRWPWTIAIETLLVVPVLDAAPPVEAIGVAARSMSQQSHISIEREHYDRAVEAIASIAR